MRQFATELWATAGLKVAPLCEQVLFGEVFCCLKIRAMALLQHQRVLTPRSTAHGWPRVNVCVSRPRQLSVCANAAAPVSGDSARTLDMGVSSVQGPRASMEDVVDIVTTGLDGGFIYAGAGQPQARVHLRACARVRCGAAGPAWLLALLRS